MKNGFELQEELHLGRHTAARVTTPNGRVHEIGMFMPTNRSASFRGPVLGVAVIQVDYVHSAENTGETLNEVWDAIALNEGGAGALDARGIRFRGIEDISKRRADIDSVVIVLRRPNGNSSMVQ